MSGLSAAGLARFAGLAEETGPNKEAGAWAVGLA